MLKRIRKWANLSAAPPSPPPEDRPRPPAANEPLDVTDADFDALVLAADKPAVVDFWAEWCQPCTIAAAYMGFLREEFGGDLLVAALDVDENPEMPARYQVMGLPTLIFFRDGAEADRYAGLLEYDELRRKVEQLLAAPPAS